MDLFFGQFSCLIKFGEAVLVRTAAQHTVLQIFLRCGILGKVRVRSLIWCLWVGVFLAFLCSGSISGWIFFFLFGFVSVIKRGKSRKKSKV